MQTYGGFKYSWFKGVASNSLLYGDSNRKIAYIMSPRAGCSVSFKFYLKSLNDKLLTDASEYNDFVHSYRCDVLDKHLPKKTIEELMNENYTFVKFVVNPYQRAVSSFRMIFDDKDNKEKYDLTFNNFYTNLIQNKKMELYSSNDLFHCKPQYLKFEEKINPIIYRIDFDKGKDLNVNGLIINLNNITSVHHLDRKSKETKIPLCNIPRRDINIYLPKKYNVLYNENNRKLIEHYYKDDIKYGPYDITDDF